MPLRYEKWAKKSGEDHPEHHNMLEPTEEKFVTDYKEYRFSFQDFGLQLGALASAALGALFVCATWGWTQALRDWVAAPAKRCRSPPKSLLALNGMECMLKCMHEITHAGASVVFAVACRPSWGLRTSSRWAGSSR